VPDFYIKSRKDVGLAIRAAREGRGISQVRLGKRLGKAGPYVNMMEQGRRAVPLHILRRIVDELRDPGLWFDVVGDMKKILPRVVYEERAASVTHQRPARHKSREKTTGT